MKTPPKGFALILVLVAIVLAGITASLVLQSFNTELRRTRTTRMEAQARQDDIAKLLSATAR